MKHVLTTTALLLALSITGCATTGTASPEQQARLTVAAQAAVDSPDRPAKDREQDAKRKPVQVLAFIGVKPGQKVIDLFSATGWYAELLSRMVEPEGPCVCTEPAYGAGTFWRQTHHRASC